MSFSPAHPPLSPSTLPKINRIQKSALSLEEQASQNSTKTSIDLLSQADYIRIYKGLTVLFLGDNSIRVLYRDLCKVLKFGRLLEYTEAACQNGNYKSVEGKSRIKEGGRIGMADYQDIRQFSLDENFTKLIYMHVSTLINDGIPMQTINDLKNIPNLQSIDLCFVNISLFHYSKKSSQSAMSVDDYLNNYLIHLERFSASLVAFAKQTNSSNPYLCWMSPLPERASVLDEKQNEFVKILQDTDHIIKQQGFTKFDRFDIWSRRQDLVIAKSGHFPLHGIREVNDCFARALVIQLKRSLPPQYR